MLSTSLQGETSRPGSQWGGQLPPFCTSAFRDCLGCRAAPTKVTATCRQPVPWQVTMEGEKPAYGPNERGGRGSGAFWAAPSLSLPYLLIPKVLSSRPPEGARPTLGGVAFCRARNRKARKGNSVRSSLVSIPSPSTFPYFDAFVTGRRVSSWLCPGPLFTTKNPLRTDGLKMHFKEETPKQGEETVGETTRSLFAKRWWVFESRPGLPLTPSLGEEHKGPEEALRSVLGMDADGASQFRVLCPASTPPPCTAGCFVLGSSEDNPKHTGRPP